MAEAVAVETKDGLKSMRNVLSDRGEEEKAMRLLTDRVLSTAAACLIAGCCYADNQRSDHSLQMADSYQVVIPLAGLVKRADRVARVRIVGQSPASSRDRGCGLLVDAEVVRSFKGSHDRFRFLMIDESDFRGSDREYLAIVLPRHDLTYEMEAFLEDMLKQTDRERLACRMSHSLYMPGGYRTIWAVDPEASHRLGEDWLEPDNRPAVQWYDPGAGAATEAFRRQEVDVNGEHFDAIAWSSARNVIEHVLDSPGASPMRRGNQTRSKEVDPDAAEPPTQR